MQYPDGSIVCLGDLIWWNEGTQRGKVALILETKEQQLEWGLSENGIFISANSTNKELSADVFCSEDSFEDEGIGKV